MEDKKDQTLEELFDELDGIATRLERGELSLEESFQLYQNGMNKLKLCNEMIDQVEKKVLVLEESGELHEF